jgi:uncharacterized phage protein gp47/JayE
MPTPLSGLSPLQLITPVIPNGVTSISVDSTVLPYVVYADIATTRLEILIYNTVVVNSTPTQVVVDGVTYNEFKGSVNLDSTVENTSVQIVGRNYVPGTAWTALTTYALGKSIIDPNGYVQVVTSAGISGVSIPTFNTTLNATTTDGQVTWKNLGFIKITPITQFDLIFYVSQNALVIAPPSGVSSYKSQSVCRLEWVQPQYAGTIGVRVQLSVDAAGITTPYVQYGDLVNNITRSEDVTIASSSSVSFDNVDSTNTTTTVDTFIPVNFSSVDIPSADVANASVFYAMVSTVVQDPNTNAIFESQQNGPITCGFVNLKTVNPTDFLALQRKEDIAGRLIQQMTKHYPDLDLTPRSEARDLLIDPVAVELSNMSVRAWFSRVATSVSAMSQIDDSDGDGFSDSFTTSPIKQQVARAYGLGANDTQALIDRQFDLLGEQAGLTRNSSTASVVTLTFYTYTKPTQTNTVPLGTLVSTVPDSETPSLTFATTGSATIDATSANSFYDPVNGWWSVNVPAQCQTAGSISQVGAGTIRSISSGAPGGWNCTNLVAANGGQDTEINSRYAARIWTRLVAGIDSGTRRGYLSTALGTPGVIASRVVAAGDDEMLRDWDSIRQKHVFGAVDIYVRGNSFSEQDESVAFTYLTNGTYKQYATYTSLALADKNLLKFQIPNFPAVPYPFYAGVELIVSRPSGSFYLGLDNAQFDNVNGYLILNPDDTAYQYVGDNISSVKVPLVLNGSNTNKTVVTYLATQQATSTYQLLARYQSPLIHTPALQPVLSINSVTGQTGQTGVVPSALSSLIHSSDYLLYGGSNKAGDVINVSTTTSTPLVGTITALTANPVLIDTAMDVTVNANGVPQNISSVRNLTQDIVYAYGIDYTIVPMGNYRTYGLKTMATSVPISTVSITNNVLTVKAVNTFSAGAPITLSGLTTATFLNAQTVTLASATPSQFTAVFNHANYAEAIDSGNASGSSIQNNQQVLVAYNKFILNEKLSLIANEQVVLTGTLPTQLINKGFVHNIWLPESYGNTTLSLDGAVYNTDNSINVSQSTGLVGALVPRDSRYIKVTYNGAIMREGIDFTVNVDATSGLATISRIVTGHILNNGVVSVTYFVTETFTVASEYPAFVEILSNSIAETKHAAADVIVKSMVANPVDITMTVTLEANASPETMDGRIRTAINRVLDNASGTLYQSELVRQVKALNGIQSVDIPLVKCAKSDGAYDVGVVVPTQTSWTPLSTDSAFAPLHTPPKSFITTIRVLPNSTIPSGGAKDSFVGLLYQGEAYRRAMSVQDFLTNSTNVNSFYIFGTNDQIDGNTLLDSSYEQKILITIPETIAQPGLLSFFVTYQVFNEVGTRDIVMSSTEYLVPGHVVINFVSA